MSAALVDLGLKLRSAQEGRAVRAATTSKFGLRPGAVVLSVVTMAGEPAALWAVGVGRATDPRPRALTVATDPRHFVEQLGVWRELGSALRPLMRPSSEDWWPQLVTATPAALAHLHAGAERLATIDDDDARYAAECLLWWAERAEHPGTQAVTTATGLLADHLATGADPSDEGRLDVWCSWLGLADATPRGGRPGQRHVGDEVDEARTTAGFDAEELAQFVSRWQARRDEDRHRAAATTAPKVKALLTPLLLARHERLVRVLKTYRTLALPPLAGLEHVAAADAQSWGQWANSRDKGWRVARRDRPRAAVAGLLSREDAAEAWERLQVGDEVGLARAVADGRAVRAAVVRSDGTELVLVTRQPVIRLRPGADVVLRDDPTRRFQVVALEIATAATRLRLTATKLELLILDPGQELVVVEPAPDFGRDRAGRANASRRLSTLPWTHDPEADRPTGPKRIAAPGDLVDMAGGR